MHTGERKKGFTVRNMVLIGVLSALVFALSMVSIQIGDISRIHFGNIMCLLSGMLFGPVIGGISAGLGSMFFDFTNPLYISEFWITFLTKFAMGFVAGLLSQKLRDRAPMGVRFLLAAIGGQVTYIILYFVKSIFTLYFVYGQPWPTVLPTALAKAGISGINGAIAVVACIIFAPVLNAALEQAGLFKKKPKPAG